MHIFFGNPFFDQKQLSKTLILHHPPKTVHKKISKKNPIFIGSKKGGQVIDLEVAKLLTLKWPKCGQVIDPTAYIYIYIYVYCFFLSLSLYLVFFFFFSPSLSLSFFHFSSLFFSFSLSLSLTLSLSLSSLSLSLSLFLSPSLSILSHFLSFCFFLFSLSLSLFFFSLSLWHNFQTLNENGQANVFLQTESVATRRLKKPDYVTFSREIRGRNALQCPRISLENALADSDDFNAWDVKRSIIWFFQTKRVATLFVWAETPVGGNMFSSRCLFSPFILDILQYKVPKMAPQQGNVSSGIFMFWELPPYKQLSPTNSLNVFKYFLKCLFL